MIYANYIKSFFDKIFALLILLVFSPLLVSIIFLIWFEDRRNVFFKQARGGYKNTIFYIYKFRTMKNTLDAQGNLLPDDQRVTKMGSFLRKTSLDELPELINILRGEMSFVGPRPFISEYLSYYNEAQKRRHDVKPGITGWAQINGRNSISWEDKFKMDLWYIDNLSFILDMKILFLTFWKVIARKDINQSENITMPKFSGSE